MNQLAKQPSVEFDVRAIFLSGIVLLLTIPFLWHIDSAWFAAPPTILAILAGICLTASLFFSFRERNKLTQLLMSLALLILFSTLFWVWPEALANLIELRLEIAGIFAVTVLGYIVHARLRTQSPTGPQITLLVSALPVLLVCGVYLLLTAATGLAIGEVRLLISIGLAITYFNLGAMVIGGGPPLDGGRILADGGRILGNGKTWRGSIGGLIMATLAFTIFAGSPDTGLLVAVIALLGDAAASFLKRRLSQEQSKQVPLLDQWDGLLPLLYVLVWRNTPLVLPHGSVLILLIGTLFIQFLGNRILFRLGKKSVPW